MLYFIIDRNISKTKKIIFLSIGITPGFLISILTTDYLLGTKIKDSLLVMTNGSPIMFFVLLVIEAVIVSFSLLLVTSQLKKIIKED